MAAGYLMIGVGFGLLIWRGGRWVPGLNRFLNVVAVLLLAFNTLQVANYTSASAAAAEAEPTPTAVALGDPAVKPDIYYIILDRYANADTLSEIYDFDNEPFLNELEARGFSIADHAWANYFKTALSLYSSLNMDYIDPARLGVDMSQPSKFREVQAALRDHLAGPSALKSIGYDYVHLGGWWEPTATNVDADVSLRYQGSTEFLERRVGDHHAVPVLAAGLRRDGAGRRDHAVRRARAGRRALCLRRAGGHGPATGSDLRVRAHPAPPPAVHLQRRRQLRGRLHRQAPSGARATTWSSCSGPTSACCRPSIT